MSMGLTKVICPLRLKDRLHVSQSHFPDKNVVFDCLVDQKCFLRSRDLYAQNAPVSSNLRLVNAVVVSWFLLLLRTLAHSGGVFFCFLVGWLKSTTCYHVTGTKSHKQGHWWRSQLTHLLAVSSLNMHRTCKLSNWIPSSTAGTLSPSSCYRQYTPLGHAVAVD